MSQNRYVLVVSMAKETYVGILNVGALLIFCQCTWPEGVPVNRNSTSREHPTDDFDGRPSTAESSGLSDTSTPPTRDHTPPNGLRLPLDMGLPPLVSRRQRYAYHNSPAANIAGLPF